MNYWNVCSMFELAIIFIRNKVKKVVSNNLRHIEFDSFEERAPLPRIHINSLNFGAILPFINFHFSDNVNQRSAKNVITSFHISDIFTDINKFSGFKGGYNALFFHVRLPHSLSNRGFRNIRHIDNCHNNYPLS